MDQEYICYLPTGRYRIEKHFAVSLDYNYNYNYNLIIFSQSKPFS